MPKKCCSSIIKKKKKKLMQKIEIDVEGIKMHRKVKFIVKINGSAIHCISADHVSKVLKKYGGRNFSNTDVYNFMNPVRRRNKLVKRGFGDGFEVVKVSCCKEEGEIDSGYDGDEEREP